MDQQEKQGQLAGELTGQQPETPADNKKKKEKRPLGLEILSWILTILVAVAAAPKLCLSMEALNVISRLPALTKA